MRLTERTYTEHIRQNEAKKAEKLELIARMMVEGYNFGELQKVLFEHPEKVDSAYPCDYAKRIREIYPNFIKGNYCYSYETEMFGEMVNMNDKFFEYLFNR
jgi:hypothetical protein